jgi:hypothetical protein
LTLPSSAGWDAGFTIAFILYDIGVTTRLGSRLARVVKGEEAKGETIEALIEVSGMVATVPIEEGV